MKHLLIILSVFITLGCATGGKVPRVEKQNLDINKGEFEDGIYIWKTFEFPDLTEKKLYELSKKWLAVTFYDSKEVLEYDNPETGDMVGQGRADLIYSEGTIPITGAQMRFAIMVEINDGVARVSFTSIIFEVPSYDYELSAWQVISEKELYINGKGSRMRNWNQKFYDGSANVFSIQLESFKAFVSRESESGF